ncbi:MAG: hypothetical protein VZR23_09860 [Lachnospiraceae bacterium]|nr:hypothetical protein [Lachnospiraceae bacterium]
MQNILYFLIKYRTNILIIIDKITLQCLYVSTGDLYVSTGDLYVSTGDLYVSTGGLYYYDRR